MKLAFQDEPRPEEESEPKWWQSGWLKLAVVLVLLVIGFYAEANILGALAWKQAQADIAAAGESLDPETFISPPVPDAENLGALPIFQMEAYPAGGFSAAPLQRALNRVYPLPNSKDDLRAKLPYLGKWKKGEAPDLLAVRAQLLKAFAASVPKDATALQVFELLCPALSDLRAASATRPSFRVCEDYTYAEWNRPLSGLTSQIKLTEVLAYEERLALLSHEPDLALDDLRLDWKIDSGMRKDPSLVGGLVSVGIIAIQMEAVREGLGEHSWNDRELAEMDASLGKLDYLSEAQFCIRGEIPLSLIPLLDHINQDRHDLHIALADWFEMDLSSSSLMDTIISNLLASTPGELIPSGWLNQYKADCVRCDLLGTVRVTDPVARRIFPEREAKVAGLVEGSNYWRNLVAMQTTPALDSIKRFAYAQSQVDEARIACRLERHRLVHGDYPKTLATLEAQYGPNPKDIMSGNDYRYRLNGDGSFLLYSVGWDQKDNGGDGTAPQYSTPQESPDWVWVSWPEKQAAK